MLVCRVVDANCAYYQTYCLVPGQRPVPSQCPVLGQCPIPVGTLSPASARSLASILSPASASYPASILPPVCTQVSISMCCTIDVSSVSEIELFSNLSAMLGMPTTVRSFMWIGLSAPGSLPLLTTLPGFGLLICDRGPSLISPLLLPSKLSSMQSLWPSLE